MRLLQFVNSGNLWVEHEKVISQVRNRRFIEDFGYAFIEKSSGYSVKTREISKKDLRRLLVQVDYDL